MYEEEAMEAQDQKKLSAEEIKETVKQIVSRISRIDAAEFADDVIIRDELGIDSLMAIEIIATCERHLQITIDEGAFGDIETVGDFLAFIVELYDQAHG